MNKSIKFLLYVVSPIISIIVLIILALLMIIIILLNYIFDGVSYIYNLSKLKFIVNYKMMGFVYYLTKCKLRLSGTKLYVKGDLNSINHDNSIIISNHISLMDWTIFPLLMYRSGNWAGCRFFIKMSVKSIPILGKYLESVGMVFLSRDWELDQQQFQAVFKEIKSFPYNTSLIMFPEATRITPDGLKQAQSYAISTNKKPTHHVLLPRYKGFIESVIGAKKADMMKLYVCTIVFWNQDKKYNLDPKLWKWMFFLSDIDTCIINLEVIDLSKLPDDRVQLKKWIQDKYYEMDDYLSNLKKSSFESIKANFHRIHV